MQTIINAPTMRNKKNNIIYEIVVAVLSLTVLAVLVIEYAFALNEKQATILSHIDFYILLVFSADYIYRFIRAKQKLKFLKENIFDLVALIPFDKVFRLARLIRLTRFVRISRIGKLTKVSKALKILRLSLYTKKFSTNFLKLLKTNGLIYMIYVTVAIVFVGAVGIMYFEKNVGNISTFGDALWWSLVTTTTVGYGDISPATTGGRILAAILMITGIGFLGMVTGAIATYFIGTLNSEPKREKRLIDEQNDYVKSKIDKIEILSADDIKVLQQMIQAIWESKKTEK